MKYLITYKKKMFHKFICVNMHILNILKMYYHVLIIC